MPGHWEGDLNKGKGNASAVGTLVELSSGYLILAKRQQREYQWSDSSVSPQWKGSVTDQPRRAGCHCLRAEYAASKTLRLQMPYRGDE
tara:strand:+ start:5238 stop:5501 length:264 start_codon:yes stop_codon:yes gene_type:complete